MENLQQIASIIAIFGLGGVLGAYFQSIFQYRKERKDDIHKLKSKRYGAMVMQMLALVDSEYGLEKLQQFRPDIKSREELINEIRVELFNGVLYANDQVVYAMGNFLKAPSHESYLKVVSSMRKDLWGKKTKIDESSLSFLIEAPSKT
ncbi:MAG: hypothetical protein AAF741_06195 [Bacteroidota bacterium]